MKAIVKYGPGIEGVELRDIPEPVPAKGQLKVKVKSAGICGTDMHLIGDKLVVDVPIVEDKPLLDTPVILGHEFVGVVEEIGEDVKGFEVGDWVVSLTVVYSCGLCKYCKQGDLLQCSEKIRLGRSQYGAMAEYVLVNANNSFLVPEKIEDKIVLGGLEPIACTVRIALQRTTIKPADLVVVSGPGIIGLGILQVAKLQGANVIVCGLPQDSFRLQVAKKLGADAIADNQEELKRLVLKRNPYGADVVFETAGADASVDMCVNIVRKRGTVSLVAGYGRLVDLNVDYLLENEIVVTNSLGAERSAFATALDLIINKKINIDPIITHRIPLENWKEAFEIEKLKIGLKVLLIPEL